MSKRIIKLISLSLAIVILVCCATLNGSAATYRTGANSASSSYKSGIYYSNFQRVELTGDGVTDVLAIALSQVGYEEGNSTSAMSGTAGGSSNYTEYCYNMGDWGGGYGGSDYAWCATFVTWSLYQSRCSNQMGYSYWCRNHTSDSSYIWCEVSCSQWANQLRRYSRFKYSAQNGGTYKPQSGDLIFFDWAGGSSGEDHIGIVVYSDSSKVYTIEGNTSDAAGLEDNGGGAYFKSYPLSYGYISGYGILPYKDVSSVPTIDYSGNNPTPGLYMAATSSASAYSTETGTTVSFTIPKYAMFEVTGIASNGRLKVTYTSGSTTKTGYIAKAPGKIVQISSTQVDGLDDAMAAAEAIYFGDYSEENLVTIRAAYAEAKTLSSSSTATYAQKKTCADNLNSLVTSLKGKGTLVGDGVYVTAFNKKITTAECNIFTPSFGTITPDKANHKWTTNVIAKWNSTKQAYYIKSIIPMKGESTTDVTIASDEIFIAVHSDSTVNANSAMNYSLVTSAKVGDRLDFYGADVSGASVSVGAYFTITTEYIPGDADKDDAITTTDYMLMKSYVLSRVTFTEEDIIRSDINGDGAVTTTDMMQVIYICMNKV